jgi:hypothetical protein
MNSFIRAFTTSVIETGLNNYMSDYKKQFNSFETIINQVRIRLQEASV